MSGCSIDTRVLMRMRRWLGSLLPVLLLFTSLLSLPLQKAEASATAVSFTVSPSSVNLPAGTTQQLTVTATLSDGTTPDVTSIASYKSSNTSKATVSSAGLITGVGVGASKITITYSGKRRFVNVNVTGQDTTPPVIGSFTVNNGAPYTNSTSVNLQLSATDNITPQANLQKQFSNDGTIYGGWTTYASTANWTLAAGDGSKTVYVQVRDAAGNIATANTGITLHPVVKSFTVSPSSVNLPAGTTQQLTVTATLSDGTTPDVTSIASYKSSNTSRATVSSAGLITGVGVGASKITITYSGKRRFVNVNVTGQDTTPPVIGSFTVNNGAPYTNSTSVNLQLSATDNITPQANLQKQFSNDGTIYGGWTTYASTANWTLAAGDGSKTVYVQVRDAAGNIATANTGITLDTTAPSLAVSTPAGTDIYVTSSSLGISGSAIDFGSGLKSLTMTQTGFNPAQLNVNSDGSFNIRVRGIQVGLNTVTLTAIDNTGNSTAYTITVTRTVPVTGVTLSKTTDSIAVGAADTLTATVTPNIATNQSVAWASDNSNIASVDQNGKVTGVSAGTANITVTTADGSYTATCPVTVTTTLTATFSADNKRVTVQASNLYTGINYVVVYLDGVGATVTGDSFSSGGTSLTSDLTFSKYQTTAQPGTWTAYLRAGDSSGTTVGQTTFTVAESSIPEFPTPLALLLVVGACAGVYAWMRRRRQEATA